MHKGPGAVLATALLSRDVNKATDSKAKAKAEAEAEAEASVPWHKLVIMHNFFKHSCNTLNLSV